MAKRFEQSEDLATIRQRLMKLIDAEGDPEITIKASAEWRQTERLRLDIHKLNMAVKPPTAEDEAASGEATGETAAPAPLHGLKVVKKHAG